MTHHHKHHHEHHHAISSLNSIFIACIVINLAFVFIEAGVGFIYNSLGLLSDAGHNLSDVFSLLLSLFAFRTISQQPAFHLRIQKKYGVSFTGQCNHPTDSGRSHRY